MRIMWALFTSKENWRKVDGKIVGVAYDGCMSFFSTAKLDFIDETNVNGVRFVTYTQVPGSNLKFQVTMLEVGTIQHLKSIKAESSSSDEEGEVGASQALAAPEQGNPWLEDKHRPVLQALDTALLGFARWGLGMDEPSWILSGAKAFRIDGEQHTLSASFVGMLGYYASLKICKAGLVLVADISYTAFLAGGDMISFFLAFGGFRSEKDFIDDVKRRLADTNNNKPGVDNLLLKKVEDELKSCKIRLSHLNRSKKFKSFGPPADSKESAFQKEDGGFLTVAEYFKEQAEQGKEKYALKYPFLPTLNAGSAKNPCLIPMELCRVPAGQSRNRGMTGAICSMIIKRAAMKPHERIVYIGETNKSSLFGSIAADENAAAFGLGRNISSQPLHLQGATILPPAKLQYGNRIIEPELTGAWNLARGTTFAHPPPCYNASPRDPYPYSMVLVYDRQEPRGWQQQVEQFQRKLETESGIHFAGKPLRLIGQVKVSSSKVNDLERVMEECKKEKTRITLLVLHYDAYNQIKMVFDRENIQTQCVKYETTAKLATVSNILQKMNMKMGGVNHTLARRDGKTDEDPATFQSPPNSISWMFDEPCMVVGVDVNHPEDQMGGGGKQGDSVAAVVASMDGMLGQYAAYVSTCAAKTEPVDTLCNAMVHLLQRFAHRNGGAVPKRIIVFRDGVADNQFDEVVEKELVAFQEALDERGQPLDAVKISIIVCQKRHHTRLVYKKNGKDEEYKNPCVGLCVDGKTGEERKKGTTDEMNSDVDKLCDSIASSTLNDFYLNSHAAVLGTSKPCKYTLIYDEIGIKMSELELLTHWTTHLYARCTRAVSYATPAYYAHWAARRGKALLNAGVSPKELTKITESWLSDDIKDSMYFI